MLRDYDAFLYHRWFSFILWWELIYKYEPLWQEVSVKSLILMWSLRPVGLLLGLHQFTDRQCPLQHHKPHAALITVPICCIEYDKVQKEGFRVKWTIVFPLQIFKIPRQSTTPAIGIEKSWCAARLKFIQTRIYVRYVVENSLVIICYVYMSTWLKWSPFSPGYFEVKRATSEASRGTLMTLTYILPLPWKLAW